MSIDDHELNQLREEIDALDAQLLQLLAQRMEKARAIGHYKKDHGLPPLDQQRWQAVMTTLTAHTTMLDLSEEFVNRLYELIHEYTLKIEADISDHG